MTTYFLLLFVHTKSMDDTVGIYAFCEKLEKTEAVAVFGLCGRDIR